MLGKLVRLGLYSVGSYAAARVALVAAYVVVDPINGAWSFRIAEISNTFAHPLSELKHQRRMRRLRAGIDSDVLAQMPDIHKLLAQQERAKRNKPKKH